MGSHKLAIDMDATLYRSDGTPKWHREWPAPKQPDDYLSITVYSPSGVIVTRQKQPVHSWVENWSKITYGRMRNINQTIVRYGGSSQAVPAFIGSILAGVGNSNYGIIVGTDDGSINPLEVDNHDLGAKIAHGATLQYSAQGTGNYTVVGSDGTLYVYRTFTNVSGGAITIKECGIVAYNGSHYVMIARDLVDQAVANGEAMQVMYTLSYPTASGLVNNYHAQLEAIFEYRIGTGEADPLIIYTDVSNVETEIDDESQHTIRCDAAKADDDLGIVVGTNDTALNLTAYKLGNRILHGYISGTHLFYGTSDWTAPYTSGDDAIFQMRRTFTNQSGSSVDMKEVGVYCEGRQTWATHMMIARLLTGTITIANNESICFRMNWKHANQ